VVENGVFDGDGLVTKKIALWIFLFDRWIEIVVEMKKTRFFCSREDYHTVGIGKNIAAAYEGGENGERVISVRVTEWKNTERRIGNVVS
jgi:hypothetical protein